MNKKSFVLSVLFILSALSSRAADLRPLSDLLHEAVRSSKTSKRNDQKLAAKAELIDRMPDSLRVAMDYVHGDNVMLQVLIMEWVTQLPSDTIVPTLLEFVNHDREETRRVAIFFLGFHTTPEHAEIILPYLEDEKCRGSTIRTLGKWKVSSARELIEHWLAAGTERVRVVSANALRDLGDPQAIPALLNALDDPVFTVRNTAARALESFGDEAVKFLDADDRQWSSRAMEMRRRCLSDLSATPAGNMPAGEVMVDGKYFTP